MSTNRRGFIGTMAGLVASGLSLKAYAQSHSAHMQSMPTSHSAMPSDMGHIMNPSSPDGRFVPVATPDMYKLPYEIEKGVKVFRLVAEVVKREFLPGYVFDLWGYNGQAPGPTIEVMEGDHVRIIFENRLPEPTTVHWHGLEVPIEMDGVPAISQPLTPPGGTYTYEFTLHQNGTFFYHSHMAMQEMMGMIGFFIIHPKKPYEPRVDKDFAIVLQEWAILPNNTIPNSFSMEFNWLTMNGKAGPATTPLIVKLGDRVRLRFVNLGMDHHPIHLHGHQWNITGTEGGRVPETAWYPNNTVLVGVAQVRDVEFVAKYPGDWMLHCHLPHHMMNHMASMVGPMAEMGMGMHSGMDMNAGMGMMEGHAMSEELGPGLGRGMGIASDREKSISHAVGHGAGHEGAEHPMEMTARVPGYPQDMHMWMPMDDMVAKPETYGLAKDWSAAITGMMTLVRTLPPDKYDEIMRLIRETGQE
ncbi:copper oxidase [Candidatus Poribacteria bacterium]|nr:copper oxidase [Candidatus Poribacteria bacterium]